MSGSGLEEIADGIWLCPHSRAWRPSNPAMSFVTHGDPVPGDGAAALHRALEREPWQRPKR